MKLVLKIAGGFLLLIILAVSAAFYFTSGLITEAETFMALVSEEKTDEAYDRLASEFKRTTTKEQLTQFLKTNGLTNLQDVSWGSRNFQNDQGLVNATVITSEGSKLPIELHFVSEDSEWKILGIHKAKTGLSEPGTSQPEALSPQSLPTEETQITLVQNGMRDFGKSIKERNMTHFHESISRTWQSQYDIQKLDEAYRGLYEMDGDLTKVSNLSPVFTAPTTRDDLGVMKIVGFFPTNPRKVKFEQKFVQEGTQWKLLGFNIKITE